MITCLFIFNELLLSIIQLEMIEIVGVIEYQQDEDQQDECFNYIDSIIYENYDRIEEMIKDRFPDSEVEYIGARAELTLSHQGPIVFNNMDDYEVFALIVINGEFSDFVTNLVENDDRYLVIEIVIDY